MTSYRPNVAAILQGPDGRILVAERCDFPGSWQFPQGGVDAGEDLIGALFREVEEELGLASDRYRLAACRTGYRYAFPDGVKKRGGFGGQEQTCFLCEFIGEDADIDVETEHPEFARWQWIRPEDYRLEWLPAFKHEAMQRIFADFFAVDLGVPT